MLSRKKNKDRRHTTLLAIFVDVRQLRNTGIADIAWREHPTDQNGPT
jgi:hypothetical protein